METKYDRRYKKKNKLKTKNLHHWIWAWSPNFIHLRKQNVNTLRSTSWVR